MLGALSHHVPLLTSFHAPWLLAAQARANALFPPPLKRKKTPEEYQTAWLNRNLCIDAAVDAVISWELAKALGWNPDVTVRALGSAETAHIELPQCQVLWKGTWTTFNYRDERVYEAVRIRYHVQVTQPGLFLATAAPCQVWASTRAAAIALVVIERNSQPA